jgi:hypothetical protein
MLAVVIGEDAFETDEQQERVRLRPFLLVWTSEEKS